jgi:hypothetical protein
MRTRELPAPLPPEERTVGQLVAETVRAYGDNFWRSLPLGLPLAILFQLTIGRSVDVQVAILAAAAPLVAAAYVRAVSIITAASPTATAFVVGIVVWFPAPILVRAYILPSLAWLALFGLSVPAAMVERLGFRDSLARSRRLAFADFVHALGSLCALVIVFVLTAAVLGLLLHGQADNAVRVAAFLSVLVLSPMLYLGGVLLYVDQAARLRSGGHSKRSRRDADLHPPVDADAAGRSDPQVEP